MIAIVVTAIVALVIGVVGGSIAVARALGSDGCNDCERRQGDTPKRDEAVNKDAARIVSDGNTTHVFVGDTELRCVRKVTFSATAVGYCEVTIECDAGSVDVVGEVAPK